MSSRSHVHRRAAVSRVAALALLVCVPPAAAGQGAPARNRLGAVVDSLVDAAMRARPSAGVTVAVLRGRDTLVLRGYGMADVENHVPAGAQTAYRIGSVTKQFTASAVLRLVEQGRIGLDDEVTRYLADAPVQGHRVTIRQLLNHTSGMPSYTDAAARWRPRWGEDLSPAGVLAIAAADSFNFAPGTAFRYNNSGYVLLGMLLEKVTGQPYEATVRALAAERGLPSVQYCWTAPLIANRARGYEAAGAVLVNAPYLSMSQPYAAGGLCATAGDLARWAVDLGQGRVVQPRTFAQMTTPTQLAGGQTEPYGFALVGEVVDGHRRAWHNGGIHGFSADLAYYPDDSVSVAVLANTGNTDVTSLARNIARAALGVPLPGSTAVRDVPLTAEDRARFAGTYALHLPNGQELPVRIFEREGVLWVQAEGQEGSALRYQGNGEFVVAADTNARFVFDRSTSPSPSLTLMQGGMTLTGTRRP